MCDKWILEIPNFIPQDICASIIRQFEEDTRKKTGMVGTSSGIVVNNTVKDTTDLYISNKSGWEDTEIVMYEYVKKALSTYITYIHENVNPHFRVPKDISDKGYQIQKYESNKGHYSWHDDFSVEKSNDKQSTLSRLLTIIVYLNDVQRGGETEFYDGTKIKPCIGKVVLFPASIVHSHRGKKPVGCAKYICTTWFYTRMY
jgi:hypothetical protein